MKLPALLGYYDRLNDRPIDGQTVPWGTNTSNKKMMHCFTDAEIYSQAIRMGIWRPEVPCKVAIVLRSEFLGSVVPYGEGQVFLQRHGQSQLFQWNEGQAVCICLSNANYSIYSGSHVFD